MRLLGALVALMLLALTLPLAAQGRGHDKAPAKLLLLAKKRQKAAVLALKFQGVPYVWGGSSPRGFDCSGLVTYVMAKVGIRVPHFTGWQIKLGVAVKRWQLKVGDVVFFHGGRHEGLVLDRHHYIEAPHTGAVVRIRRITRHLPIFAIRRFVHAG